MVMLTRPEHDPDGAVRVGVVEKVFHRLAAVLVLRLGGQEIGTTAEHPFWVVGQGWTPAGQLRVGDSVGTEAGAGVIVEGVRETGELQAVYNLRVAECHTYFVGEPGWGWAAWSHNAYYQVGLDHMNVYRSLLDVQGLLGKQPGRRLIASFNLNQPSGDYRTQGAGTWRRNALPSNTPVIYVMIDRSTGNVMKVGSVTGNGTGIWSRRFDDYRNWAVSEQKQISIYAFEAKGVSDLAGLEMQVRTTLYKSGQTLDYDYEDKGSWRNPGDPHRNPTGNLTGTPSLLVIGDVVANTPLAGQQATEIDLTYKKWTDFVRALTTRDQGKGQYVYLLEDRSATNPDLSLLKVGNTAEGYQTVYDRLAKYRTIALHRKPLTIHMFEVSSLLASGETLQAFEMRVRKSLYRIATPGVGQPWLPADHQDEKEWRLATGDPYDSRNDNTNPATLKGTPPVIPGLPEARQKK